MSHITSNNDFFIGFYYSFLDSLKGTRLKEVVEDVETNLLRTLTPLESLKEFREFGEILKDTPEVGPAFSPRYDQVLNDAEQRIQQITGVVFKKRKPEAIDLEDQPVRKKPKVEDQPSPSPDQLRLFNQLKALRDNSKTACLLKLQIDLSQLSDDDLYNSAQDIHSRLVAYLERFFRLDHSATLKVIGDPQSMIEHFKRAGPQVL
jgi:hypothetical protein